MMVIQSVRAFVQRRPMITHHRGAWIVAAGSDTKQREVEVAEYRLVALAVLLSQSASTSVENSGQVGWCSR